MAELKYFISYSRTDSAFVLELAKALRAAGVNLWLDQLDILGGERWDRAVEQALQTCQAMIAVLSPAAVASDHVMDEISFALGEEKLVIPVIVQSCEVPFRLRRLQYIDFTANYQTAFSQLLKALRIEQPSPPPRPSRPEPQIPTNQAAPPRRPTGGSSRVRPSGVRVSSPQGQRTVPVVISTGRQTLRQRLIGALVGFGIGTVFIMLVSGFFNLVGLFLAILGAISGAICGTDRRLIKAAAIGCLVAGISGAILFILDGAYNKPIGPGLFWGGTIGALGGAIVGVILKKRRTTS